MKIKSKACLPIILLAIMSGSVSYASGISIDPPLIMKTYANGAIESAEKGLIQQGDGIMKNEVSDMSGVNAIGTIMNSQQDLQNAEWSAQNWSGALSGQTGADQAVYDQLRQDYENNSVSVSSSTFAKGSNQNATKSYENQVATNRAVSIMAERAYDQLDTQLSQLHQLMSDISTSTNATEKESMDLNSRITGQLGLIEIEQTRLLAVIAEQLAAQNAARIADETAVSESNTVPSN